MTTPSSAATHAEGSAYPAAAGGPWTPINRRQALVAAGLGAGALTIAACGSSSTAAASSTPTPSTAPSAAPPSAAVAPSSVASSPVASSSVASSSVESSSAVATSSAAPTSSAPSSATPAANAIIALSKVPVGGAVAAKDAGGADIIVAQPTAGKVVAFSAVCTHKGCAVAVAAAAELDCPCHGSKFNALTGAVLTGPATVPLPSVAVKVAGAGVVAG